MTDSRTSHKSRAITPLREHRCPLCGADNRCQPAASGSFDTQCWCMTETINPESLKRIPDSQRGKACLCPSCARSAGTTKQT
ncbi:cysteine-rich CWC family protein [Thalassolituus sp.]|uniref:cysteine-rich CWC family protein n=1 Tax=Thalassolituus sp. TaxID=2030822 RepID=UPI0035195B85